MTDNLRTEENLTTQETNEDEIDGCEFHLEEGEEDVTTDEELPAAEGGVA